MKYRNLTSVFAASIVLFTTGMSIITTDEVVSKEEGRTLQLPPTKKNLLESEKYTIEKYNTELSNGLLFKKWDNYFSDHIYNRSGFVKEYTKLESLIGKKYTNETFLGEDDFIFTPKEVLNLSNEEYKKRAEHYNNIGEAFSNASTYLVNIPNKEMVYEDKMPINNYISMQQQNFDKLMSSIDLSKIKVIDTKEALINKEDMYYKTDHHLTMKGAYEVYANIINKLGNEYPQIGEPISVEEFDIVTYKDSFRGSDAVKAGNLSKAYDDMQIYNHANHSNISIYDVKKEKYSKLYHEDQLDNEILNNRYRLYLGGNRPQLIIKNEDAPNDLKVAMIGDSMDNPIIPLLSLHFSEIQSFDQRSSIGFKGSIHELVKNSDADIILLTGSTNFIIESYNGEIFPWDNLGK